MSNKLSNGTNWPKRAVQCLSILFIVFVLTPLRDLAFPDFQGLTPFIKNFGELGVPVYILATAAVFLFGHIFCGYICPAGAVFDIFSRIRNGFAIRPLTISENSAAHRILSLPKYVILFITVDWIMNGQLPVLENWILITAAGTIIIMSIVIDRFWCRFLCPAGAVQKTARFVLPTIIMCTAYWAITEFTELEIDFRIYLGIFCFLGYLLEILWNKTHLHILRIVKDEDRCTHCGECQRICPYDVDLVNFGEKSFSADCTHCGECISSCRHSALALGVVRKTDPNRGTTRFAPAILIFLIIAASVIVEIRRNSVSDDTPVRETILVPSDSTSINKDTLSQFVQKTEEPSPEMESVQKESETEPEPEPEPQPQPKPEQKSSDLRSFSQIMYGFYSVDGKQVRRKREDVYSAKTAYVYDLTDFSFIGEDKEKAMMELAGMIEPFEGSLGVFYRIDSDGKAHIDVKYVNPLRKAKIHEAITESTWTVRDEKGKNSTVPASIRFHNTGLGYVYSEHKTEFGF